MTERVAELSAKLAQQKGSIETEEATKNAFVMPFIGRVLGYDVFNPSEVIPEFTADVGTKKGEKIDYALVHGGQVQMLIEAKKVTEPLRLEHASQLYRYFSVTNARVAILTNGQIWEFYTDLDEPTRWTPSRSSCLTWPRSIGPCFRSWRS
ncbi:type I restriction endonuclease [Saccharopolyspora pogona]|nr:type I restriction endonuclease [Saccharopolyspora pogona]